MDMNPIDYTDYIIPGRQQEETEERRRAAEVYRGDYEEYPAEAEG
jgi:hypothetical protein